MTKKKVGLLIGFGVPALVGLYLITKGLLKPKSTDVVDAPPPPKTTTPPSTTTTATPKSVFPIKSGSRGDAVKTLQTLLNSAGAGLSVDGIFGTKTQAALVKIYGKTQIDSQTDLNSLKNTLSEQSVVASNLDWAWQLVDAYNSNPLKIGNLVVNRATTLYGIKKNFQGIWKQTGQNLNMAAHNYRLSDYALVSAMSNGTLRIEVTNGDLAGMYATDPNIRLSDYFDIQ